MNEEDKTLYGLTTELREQLESISDPISEDDNEDALPALIEKTILALTGKTDAVCGYLKFIGHRVDNVSRQIKELQEVKDSLSRREQRLEDYIKTCLDQLGVIELKGDNSLIKMMQNPASVEITDLNRLPVQFLESRYVHTAKKTEIMASVKATGEIPEGVNIIRKRRLKITNY